MDTVREIKEKLCYVGYDIPQERRLAEETTVLVDQLRLFFFSCHFVFFFFSLFPSFTLPDGRVITMGRERFEAPEALFTPALVDVEVTKQKQNNRRNVFFLNPFVLQSMGMADLLFKTIQSADIDLRSDFYKHIVLSGGSSMYPGLPSRLEKDIKSLYLKNVLKDNTEGCAKQTKEIYLNDSAVHKVLFCFCRFEEVSDSH